MAQDKLWVNGPQLLDFNNLANGVTVCGLPTGQDYNGAMAQYAQNAQYDENGNLLFFIQDGKIYDHAGYLMADNDLDPNCTDCLPAGMQEVSIVLMPGTCDKYYIISGRARKYPSPGADPACYWPLQDEQSFLAYSILDLALPSRYYGAMGRKGRVWHYLEDWSVHPLVTANIQAFQHMANQVYTTTCMPISADPAVFKIASGNYSLYGSSHHSSRLNNIYHVVYEGTTPGAQKYLFARTGMEYLHSTITPFGIPNMQYLADADNFTSWSSEAWLYMNGGLAAAQGGDGVVRLVCTNNWRDGFIGSTDRTLAILKIQLVGGISLINRTDVNTRIPIAPGVHGRVQGVAFDATGRYLYFAQSAAPYIGYIDLYDPALTVHDLAAELSLPPGQLAPYGNGHIRLNRDPSGVGHAIHFPYASGIGYLSGAGNPALHVWHPLVPGTPQVGPPPVSGVLQSSSPYNMYTRYLMDMQNYRDQQIPSLQQGKCCLANEQVPEWSHPYTYSGTNTPTTPWTTTQNGLTGPMLCTWPLDGNGQPIGHAYFNQDFVIQAGARLYVQGMEWRFAPTARLIVEPGAFVQFKDCLLRGGACGPERWPGVEVRAITNMPQGSNPAFPPNHGKMVFNNSTVQDAEVGVTLGKKNMFGIVQFVGGILQSTGSTFRNCRVGANFYPYKNLSPGGFELPNNSRFSTSTFTADAGYINHAVNGFDFAVQAQMWKVKGIRYQGCTFQNLRTTENQSSKRGQGIRSLDAEFHVTSRCADLGPPPPPGFCHNVIPSKFINLDHGIHANTASNLMTFTVEESEFTNNVAGVYVRGVPAFQVQHSSFSVGGSHATILDNTEEVLWQNANRGTYSYQSQGFVLQHNTAQRSPTTPVGVKPEGFVTGWTQGNDDLVRWNDTYNLHVGFAGEGICSDYTQVHGLVYRCNTTNGDGTGIKSRVVPTSPSSDPFHIIRFLQGTSDAPAGNKFIGNDQDIVNDNPARALQYWWWQPAPTPYYPYTIQGIVLRSPTEKEIDCDDHLPVQTIAGGEQPPPATDPAAYRAYLMNVAQARKLEYANHRYLYDQLIDGGSTDETVQQIQSTWPNEAWDLRAMLLAKSPYLSAEVLMEAVNKNIMPAAMVAEVYVANPEAVQKSGLLKWLEQEAPIVMPPYLLDNIAASWDQKTYRTTLENNMAHSRGELSQAIYHTWASYTTDTTGVPVDSIRAALQVLRTTEARYMELLSYLEQDRFDSAMAVMDRLPDEFRLKDGEISEKDRTKQYIGLVQGWRNAGRTDAELTADEIATLQALVEGHYDRPAEWAQNLLCFGYGICRAPLSGGEDAAPQGRQVPVGRATAPTPLLKLAPNPANAWVAMDYRLEPPAYRAYLLLRDATGRQLEQIAIAHTEGQAVYDTRPLAPGPYTVELVNGGQLMDAQKLIVQP